MSTELTQKNLLINNTKISYYETGGKKADILLLHGWAHAKELWKSIIIELGKDYRVIAPDLPGFGDSGKPEIKYTYNFYLDVFYEFWENTHNPHTQSYIIGHSFGGTLAVEIVCKYSFERLILVSTPITPIWLAKSAIFTNSLTYKLFSACQNFTPMVKLISRISVKESKYATDLMIQTAKKFSNRAGMDVLSFLAHVNLKDKVFTLDIPTLFIIGENDNFVSPSQYKVMNSCKSDNFQILKYQDCGHTPFMEKEDRFLSDVKFFLNR
jgi:pimeloyl-ACP methyl ester carboxylesterase